MNSTPNFIILGVGNSNRDLNGCLTWGSVVTYNPNPFRKLWMNPLVYYIVTPEKNSVFLSFCHYTSCIQARLPYHMYSTLPRKHLAQLLLLFLLYDTKGLLLYTLSILTLAKNGSKWAIPAHTGQNWVWCFRFGLWTVPIN